MSAILTTMECHRTQASYEDSLIYKIFILTFTINFSFLFYLTFFKVKTKMFCYILNIIFNVKLQENFYTYPSDKYIQDSLFGLRTDRCTPAGCLVDLSVQLFFILAYGNLKNNVYRLLYM